MVGTSQMAATAVVLITLAISWTPTGIAMAAPGEQRLDERTEDRMAMLEVRMAQLVTSLRVDELIPKMEAVLRKLEENSPTTSDTLSSVLRAVGAASTTCSTVEKGLVRLEERMTQLVTSLKVDELLPKVDAILRKLEGSPSTTSNPLSSALPPVEAASTTTSTTLTSPPPMIPEERKALGEALFKAAAEGRARDVEKLLQDGADVDYHKVDKYNRTALHVAAGRGHEDVMALLIAAGADANIRDDDLQNTPLHLAAWEGKDAAVRSLLAAGADLNTETMYGRTPLRLAAWKGHVAAAQALIAAGADLNRPDSIGQTPLHVAASKGHKEIVKALIAAGARKEIRDNDGKTPYDVASRTVRDLFQP